MAKSAPTGSRSTRPAKGSGPASAASVERSRAAEITKLQRLVFNAEGFADGWRLGDDGHGIVTATDRELLKAWVDVLGPPIFRRPIKYGKRRLSTAWSMLDGLRPAPVPDYYTESVPA